MESCSEIIPGLVVSRKRNGRCVYSAQAKAALVEACLRPGVSVARLALTHGVNANLLRKWIRQYQRKQGSLPRAVAPASRAVALLPVTTLDERLPAKPPLERQERATESCIEIVLSDTTARLHGRVDIRQLRDVIDCIKRGP